MADTFENIFSVMTCYSCPVVLFPTLGLAKPHHLIVMLICSPAFPAIGTGNLGIPRLQVAKWMFDEVLTFGRTNAAGSLKTVNFVLYDRDRETIKVGRMLIHCTL